jgi:hypothetical protein
LTTAQYQAHAAGHFEAFKLFKGAANSGQLGDLIVADDESNRPLQAADLLAYEINKHTAGFERGSYKSLCEIPHGTLKILK